MVWAVAGTAVATAAVGYAVVRRYAVIGPFPPTNKRIPARAIQRAVIDLTRQHYDCSWFVGESLLTTKPVRASNNGHGKAGAVRDEARRWITSNIVAQGWRRCEISPSSQSRHNTHTVVQHFAPADLAFPVADDIEGDWDVLVGIDVDYYIDDIEKYLGYAKPVVFHTFNPLKVAGMDGDCRYRISRDHVQYEVGGGGNWHHQVWDWCAAGEFIAVPVKYQWKNWFLGLLGLQKTVFMKVYHARPWDGAPDRVLVWIVPSFSCWSFKFMASDIHARRLARVKYSDDTRAGWNKFVAPEGGVPGGRLMINVGPVGADATVSMEKVHYDILMRLSNTQAVTTRMIGLKYTSPADIALFCAYHRGDKTSVTDGDSAVASTTLVHWPYATDADVPEVSSRTYAKALVDSPNLMPMVKRWDALSESLERRVTFVANSKKPTKHLSELAVEFVSMVVPDVGIGVPLSVEDAATALDKPSQVLAVKAVWDTLDMPARPLIESFLKNEPTMKCGRIISSFADARFLLLFSRFTLAFRDQVLHSEHNSHWFCPGLTPSELADKVCGYAGNVDGLIEGDYSNFDGTVSAWLQRHVMNAVYHRYFNIQYKTELQTYTDKLVTCPARAKRFGFVYDAGVGVKSGSPTTCDLNTVLNAYLMYAAIRLTNRLATPKEAFGAIGLAFGDDSLFEKQYKRQWVRVVEQLGMSLKVEECQPETGVTFLARVFPDPLSTTTSFQDPLRTWRKLHLTARDPNVPLADAATDRLEGYLTTDAYTPVTSNYARMVIRFYSTKTTVSRSKRKDKVRELPFWATQGGAWPQDPRDTDLMLNCVAARTGFEPEELRSVMSELDACTEAWSGPVLVGTPQAYAHGVLPGGGTAEPEVDHVSINVQRDVNHSRASGGVGQERQRRSDDGGERGRQDGELAGTSGGQTSQGSAKLCRLPHQRQGEAGQGNGRAFQQAEFGQTTGSHRPGPRGRATTRAARSGRVSQHRQVSGSGQSSTQARRSRGPEGAQGAPRGRGRPTSHLSG